MATSSALNTSNQYVKYKITVTQNSQNTTSNKSNVTVKVNFYRTNTGYTTYGTGTVYCRIDGTLYTAAVTSSQKITNSGIDLFTKTLDIAHNEDGTKTLSVSAWISHNAPLTSNEQSYSQKLTTIPRASQPSCITWPEHTQNVGYFGDTISIHTNRKSSDFTHTLRYQFGNQKGTIATGVENGTTWEIPLALMELIPNVEGGSGTIYCDTYNGSTLIGTKYCGFTAAVPSSVKPTCSIQVLDATDVKDTYGNLVQSQSKLWIKTTATPAYGAEINSYYVTVTSVSDTGDTITQVYSGAEVTTDVLPLGGNTVTVSATVTDARGRIGEAAAAFPVLAYNKPDIGYEAYRVDKSGREDESGEYIWCSISGEASELNGKNYVHYIISYKKESDTAWTTRDLSTEDGLEADDTWSTGDISFQFVADGNSGYNFKFIATDDFSTVERTLYVSSVFALYNCHPSGTGIKFGGIANKENTLSNALSFEQIGNSYAYQPEAFSGEKGYTLLARVQLNTLNVNAPIVFVINRRGALCPMTVYARFASSSTSYDPDLASLTYDGDNFGAFMVKEDTSVWKLYVDNTSGWSNPCLQSWYTTENQRARITVDFPSEQASGTSTDVLKELAVDGVFYRATPAKMQSILDFVYPVGSVYISYSHDSPATLFGGTWVRITNAFLWATDASGVIGQTGGEKEHTLTVAELPAHTHTYTTPAWLVAEGFDGNAIMGEHSTSTAKYTRTSSSTGSGNAHNNMPPYVQVSVWRRTA